MIQYITSPPQTIRESDLDYRVPHGGYNGAKGVNLGLLARGRRQTVLFFSCVMPPLIAAQAYQEVDTKHSKQK